MIEVVLIVGAIFFVRSLYENLVQTKCTLESDNR